MANQIISIDRSESFPTEPVTLAEVKSHLIITSTDDDVYLTSLITACRKAVENFCHISIARQTITAILIYDCEQELPYGPVTDLYAVGSSVPNPGSGPVTYSTATSGWQTDGLGFMTFAGESCARYRLSYGAGYAVVPDDLKLAVLNEIAFRYELRGEKTDIIGICPSAQMLANAYKRYLWF